MTPEGAPPTTNSQFQAGVRAWMLACFGEVIARDCIERNFRFLEEALELVQSCGCSAEHAHRLVDYVYSRDGGEVGQEVGGVMVTLAALCSANGQNLEAEAARELSRVWTAIEKIRAKQAGKHERGVGVDNPLP